MNKIFTSAIAGLFLLGSAHAQISGDFNLGFLKKDKDKDGIVDKQDRCPNLPGLKSLKGCPDRDKDGIADNKDDCPDFYAPENARGCPDSDGDGLIDIKDKCPQAAGGIAFDGCPDFDGDGVVDQKDECPTVAGIKSLGGCPDSDGDGIVDIKDKCPNESGTSLNRGCPHALPKKEIVVEVVEKKSTIKGQKRVSKTSESRLASFSENRLSETQLFLIKKLNYAPKSTTPTEESMPTLDEMVALLKANQNQKLQVNSFTDSQGNSASNYRLSVKRAKVILDYLTNKGIEQQRLKASAFGESKNRPVNRSPKNFELDRRVELVLFTETGL